MFLLSTSPLVCSQPRCDIGAPRWHTDTVNKTGRGVGSNQYQSRDVGVAVMPASPGIDLMDQVAKPNRVSDTWIRIQQENKSDYDAANDTSTHPDQLTAYLDHHRDSVVNSALENSNTPTDAISRHFDNMCYEPQWQSENLHQFWAIQSMLRNPACPKRICETVARSEHGDTSLAIYAGGHPHCPPEAVEQIWPVLAVRHISRLHLSAAKLSKLATSEDYHVRAAVASNPYTSSEDLHRLSRDKTKAVRIKVANNLATPGAVLGALCRERSPEVRSTARHNPSLPDHIRAMMDLVYDS